MKIEWFSSKKLNVVFLSFIVLVLSILISPKVEAKIPTVVINPGHSLGYDSGAVGNDVQEAKINSDVAAKVGNQLQNAGYNVYLTHPANGWLGKTLMSGLAANTLANLGPTTNSVFPDLALSIHSNAGAASASGYEFYWSSYKKYLDSTDVYEVRGLWSDGGSAYRDSTPCAEAQASLRLANLLKNQFSGLALSYRQTVERDDHMPANTNCACTLIETGFVTNANDARLLSSDSYQNDLSSRIVGAINDFFGGSPIKDETPPKAESVTTDEQETTNAVFTVYANGVTDEGTGVKEVLFPVWTDENGQDDIVWYPGEKVSDNQWKVSVDMSKHGNRLGKYIVHCYGYDYSGNSALLGTTTVNLISMGDSIPNGISVSKIAYDKYKVYAKGYYSNYKNFLFSTWSVNGGQDDIKWYEGTRQTDGSFAYTVNIEDHNYDTGNYSAHVYAVNKTTGKQEGLGGITFNVPDMAIESVTVGAVADAKFDVTVKIGVAPAGINVIQIPVWSNKNGQDDIVWYRATKIATDTYRATVDLTKHHCDEGAYIIHIYGTNNFGKMNYLGNTTQTVKGMTAQSITAGEVSDGKFTVTVSGIDAPAGIQEILVPVWSNNGGQDDINWYTTSKQSDGSYQATVGISKHHYDGGTYSIHVYGRNKAGVLTGLGMTTQTVKGMTAQSITAGEVSNGKFTVTVSGIDAPAGIQEILVPVWSSIGGQDDINWYTANRQSDGSYRATVDLNKHRYDGGVYYIHVYGRNKAGALTGLGTTSQIVKGMTAQSVTAGEVSGGSFTVTISGIDAPAGIQEMLVPVWSNNGGQDDINWYTASKQSDGSYKATVDLSKHRYDGGTYSIHVYGRNNYGTLTFLGNTNQTVKGMTVQSITAGEVSNGKFTVTVSGIDAPGGIQEIQVPVWSNNGGQDDIIWYSASRQSDGSYRTTVDLSKHHYDGGTYNIHVYGRNNYGLLTFLGNTNQTVKAMTAQSVSAGEVIDGKFTVTVSGIDAPFGLSEVLIPVWSDVNGQDDIQWYQAKRQNDGSYTLTVDVAKHKNNQGVYRIHVYGRNSQGTLTFLGNTDVTVTTSSTTPEPTPTENPVVYNGNTTIMGSQGISKENMVNYYRSQATFPSYYEARGVGLEDFVQMYIDEGKAEGVRPEIAFAQMLVETGYLRFGGQVSISQFNFAGIGATDGGAAGQSFAADYGDNSNGIRMGIRAQIQHLKAYASSENLVNACVDPRFHLVTRSSATRIGDLGNGKWATDSAYAGKIINKLEAMQ